MTLQHFYIITQLLINPFSFQGEGQDGALLDAAAAAGLPLPEAGAQVDRTKETVRGPAAPRDAQHPQHDARLPAVGLTIYTQQCQFPSCEVA